MRLIKLVPIIGFCAVSLLPASAIAQRWVVNCESNLCMDATQEAAGGMVQVSTCDKEKVGQQWDDLGAEMPKQIKNRWNQKCLDLNVDEDKIQTNDCNNDFKAQSWHFTPTGGLIKNAFKEEKCLVAENKDLTAVSPAECDPKAQSQLWKLVNVGDTEAGCSSEEPKAETEEVKPEEAKPE